ncbi:hypothetical protein AV530_000733 [Patagioenas fasciata monilis]|uniref:Arf-GAP with GTPase, ANK repeat and PH domain-containing protein 3 n=1 Tax=Patagioenas fasciata monilis TaxID=372326 RepID=A0A1V4JER7_PATFA|nr:hypothetical protein AV530_000733 [Patagioenas fasciata monilis]
MAPLVLVLSGLSVRDLRLQGLWARLARGEVAVAAVPMAEVAAVAVAVVAMAVVAMAVVAVMVVAVTVVAVTVVAMAEVAMTEVALAMVALAVVAVVMVAMAVVAVTAVAMAEVAVVAVAAVAMVAVAMAEVAVVMVAVAGVAVALVAPPSGFPDSFVNSQEWTLSRSVPELKVGIVGNLSSGKSALVHRYLTGTYVQEESPEGGRFKKEIVVDGQSYLLLIRDEGGPPELQFAAWVDAVVFVFSLEDEISFQTVYNYYLRLCSYRNTAEVPMVLVGTQDAISATNPRVIDDSRARKLSNDLKRCTYYETCATYGLNVERVFQDVQ